MPNRTHDFQQLAAQAPPSPPHERKRSKREKDPFTREAYRISAHVTDLKRFLSSVRRAYLATEKHHRRSPPPAQPQKPHDESSLFALFDNVTCLTDPERDEIDYQAKVIIQRCLDSIRELEQAEKIRLEQPKPRHRLAGLLSAVLHESHREQEDVLALHRSSILWLLNKRLTEASQLQKSQQETRLTREIEKSENQLFRSSAIHTKMEATPPPQQDDDAEPFPTLDLSDNQLQMLERENATMIEELNSTLTQVRSAEQALLEISTLQTQLMSHLNAQTLQTDRLYADSVATRERVEQGNLQLIQTRERNRGTRKFMFIFLFGASLVLLFLDWYS